MEKFIYLKLCTIFRMILFLLCVTIPLHAQSFAPQSAKDVVLANITSDYVSKTYQLSLRVNEQELITAILTKSSKKNKLKVYPINVLNKPITLVKALSVELVTLKCINFNTSRGCDIIIDYPRNITLGIFRSFHAKLLKYNGKWQLQDQTGNRFTKLHLQSKTLLGILVGIKRILPLYEKID